MHLRTFAPALVLTAILVCASPAQPQDTLQTALHANLRSIAHPAGIL
jgi:hypothetical protein